MLCINTFFQAINVVGGNMEIKKENKVVDFIKKYGVYVAVGVVVFAVALTFTLLATLGGSVRTSVDNTNFVMPMSDASIVKDYSDTNLQLNETLNQWEAHLSVDLTSENSDVFAVLGGTVSSVDYEYLKGYVVTIDHGNGFVSTYSSLADGVSVEEGDRVSAGQKIGSASESASGELELGSHLHFTLMLNDEYVNPNDYLDLQLK